MSWSLPSVCCQERWVAVVHHETTAGTLNDVEAIGQLVHAHDEDLTFIVDSMSGFGCYDVDLAGGHVHYIVSSANKNIEGVPGFGFAIVDREKMLAQGAHARRQREQLTLAIQTETTILFGHSHSPIE